MVLQQNHKNPIWGWADAGETIKISIAGQNHTHKSGCKRKLEGQIRPNESIFGCKDFKDK